jgi:hypothetical protein
MKKIISSLLLVVALGFVNLSFGQVSNYTFAQAAGTPTLLTATYTQHTSGTTDYATYTAIPIGFTFQFNCNPYTTVSISNDGYIVMGSSIWGTTTPISSASENNVISALAGDLQGLATGSLRSKTAGTAPNRTFTVEWKNYRRWSNGGDMTFQIILYETTNVIEMVYTTATALSTASDFQTGLSGATNADFNNRTKAANANWTASTVGGTNAAVMSVNTTLSRHPSGIFTWTPPGCSGTPTAGTAAASPSSICATESTNLSITGGTTGCGLTYQWQSSPDNAAWTNIAGATAATYTATPSANTYYRRIITCTASGLSANSASVLVSIVNCVILGTGTSTTTHPYTGGWEDARSQYIITADELTAAGFCGGSQLTSLAFNVSSKNSSAVYNGFSLKMGHTTATQFTTATFLVPTWTNVYSANWTTAVGWNVHPFSTNFTWNGTDNVVVETCFNNAGYTSSDYVYYTNTALNTACYAETDGATGCTLAAETRSTNRPNMKFNYVVGPPCAATPTGGTSAASPASICVGDNSTLSLTGQTIGCGITLQWQSSPNPVTTWTNIAGATGASYVASPTVSTNYRCLVTCTNSGLSAPSSVSLVTIPIVVPNCATYTSPTNGATNISCGIDALLNWTAPTVTACNPATSYDIYFGTNPAPPFVVNQTALMYNPGTLLPSTTYYWRIVPRNSNGAAVCATVWSFTTGATFNVSQTSPPISDGFENCLDWTIVNGAQVNKWILGNATARTGTKSMYVNNTGTNNNYAHTSSVVHFYKDIVFPAGNNDYTLSFYWKGEGESTYDYLQVFLAPTSVTPAAGTQVNSSYSITPYIYSLSGGLWQYYSNTLSIACGGNETKRLIFSWRNDGSGGTQPPSAIDDIEIVMTPRTGTTCANPVNITLPYVATSQTTQCMGDNYNNTAVPCTGNNYVLDQDKVYKAVIGAAGCVNVNITNSSSNSIGFQVYDGCPDAGGNCIYASSTGASGGTLTTDINIPAPGFYYIIVDSWNVPSDFVTYDINISAPGGNTLADPCSGAIPLTLGVSEAGDNTCTNAIGEPAAPACWTTGVMNTVWYRVTIPASRDLIIKTTAGSLLRTQIDFYRGNSCAGLTYVNCNQDAASCGTSYDHSQLYLMDIPGADTYLYIRVDGENNLVGTFSITAFDGNNVASPVLPPVPGQDCGPVLTHTYPVCGQNNYVPNPGNFAYGNICDYTGSSICLASGERSSTWYTININANGTLAFNIVPNDWSGSPSTVATDYDWALWRWEPTCDGLGDNTFCCAEIAAGTSAATRCNYNSLGVTGIYTTAGTAPPTYPGFGAAYDANLAVTNGEIFVLSITNFANNYTSGYSLDFSATSPIAYSTPGSTMTWASNTSNTWTSAGNWGGCGPPNCGINGVIAAGGAQPVISSNVTVKDLTINAGAILTINPGVTVTICGDLNNYGTLNASPTSTILFDNGSVVHTIRGNVTGTNKLGNLRINKTGGSVVLETNLEVGGSFTTQNTTSILNVANYYFKIGGNFSTAANTTIINCPTIEFNGIVLQTYTNNSGTLTFPNVVMNNTGGGVRLVGTTTSNLYVSSSLTLTNGILYTANPPLLVMNAGSTSTSGSALSFVDGPMDKIGNTAFVFPVGDAFNRWMRIAISAPSVSSTFRAQYFYTPYSNLTPMATTPTPVLNNVSSIEFWQLDRVAGTGNASVTLYWENAASSGINSCAPLQGGDLVVARWNGSAWENRSNTIVGGITGTCGSFGTVTSDLLTAFSPFTFSSKSPLVNPLPVEWLSFTGKNNGKENVLEWSTAMEVNNDYFTLERSLDGYQFTEVTTVKGSGNSNIINRYQGVDINPENGINYYRLKQTDFDGTVKYAPNLVVLRNEKDIEYTLYPNPVNNELAIYAELLDKEQINIAVTDISGRIVVEQKLYAIGGGNYVSMDVSQLTEGVYFVTLNRTNSSMISKKKFVKMK